MKKVLIFLSLLTCLSNILGASLTGLDENLSTNILEYLAPDDLQSIRRTNQQFRDMLAPNSYLRSHMFDVALFDGDSLSLMDYLQGEQRSPIIKIKNLVTLIKESPSAFIRLMLKSFPNTSETIESGLRSFYHDALKISDLIESLPSYDDKPQQKMTAVLIELEVWELIWDQVWAQVRAQISGQVEGHVWVQLEAQVEDQVWDQVEDHVRALVEDQAGTLARAQISGQVSAQVRVLVRTHVRALVGDQVRAQVNDLLNFQLSPVFEDGNLNEVLKPAIDYVFSA